MSAKDSYADDLTREEIEILREDLLADTAWLEGGKERVRRLCAMAFRASSGSLKNAAPQGAPMATRGVTGGSSPVASTPAGAASYRVLGMYCKKHGGRGWTDTDLDQFDRIVCPGCNPSFMPPTGPLGPSHIEAVLARLQSAGVFNDEWQGLSVETVLSQWLAELRQSATNMPASGAPSGESGGGVK